MQSPCQEVMVSNYNLENLPIGDFMHRAIINWMNITDCDLFIYELKMCISERTLLEFLFKSSYLKPSDIWNFNFIDTSGEWILFV